MSIRKSLGRLLVFAILQIGVYSGVKVHPEEIEKLLNIMNRTRVVHVVKKDDPPE